MAVNPGTELATLDFGNLIGGPLVAIITAQSIAAKSTADFIKSVGFDTDNNPIYVDFKYPKETQPYQPAVAEVLAVNATPAVGDPAQPQGMQPQANVPAGDTRPVYAAGNPVGGIPVFAPAVAAVAGVAPSVALPAVYQEMKISVPILTMLPIPFIKVDLVTIDFNAKITSMETASTSSDMAISGTLEVRQRWPSGSAKLNVSAAFKKSSATGSSVERTYSMAIHVQASQDEMPAGMEKLLNILEGAMQSTPGKQLPPVPISV